MSQPQRLVSRPLTSGFGLINKPKIKAQEFKGALILHATLSNDGAVAIQLPPAFNVTEAVMKTVPALNTSGLPASVILCMLAQMVKYTSLHYLLER